MIHHVVGLFTHPDQEWKEIRGDQEESISHMYLTHTLILAAIPLATLEMALGHTCHMDFVLRRLMV